MAAPPHQNTGRCLKCAAIFDRYPGFHAELRAWFEKLQSEVPEAHISEAGRGKKAQEDAFTRRASRAHWLQSSHNFNAALDIFKLGVDKANKPVAEYPRKWFNETVMPRLDKWLDWYGSPGSPFFELPHVQVRGWVKLVKDGTLKAVE